MPIQTRVDVHDVVGREAHCQALESLLGPARAGHGGALVLVGEPGVGKTALLRHAMATAGTATVLAVTGLESEASLPYAGLGDLLRSLLPLVSGLPDPQARALRAALALADGGGEISRYAVCMATLTLLTTAAEQEPVLVVVDDAQWIDRPSLSTLLFASRRLSADPVAIVFAVRDTAVDDLDAAHLDTLRVAGLDREAADTLLDRLRPGRLAPGVVDELWQATGGNPLALIDAGKALTDDQLAGAAPLPDPLPVAADLQRAFAARLGPLPEQTRVALLVAALSASADVDGIHSAMAWLGIGLAAADHAVDAGLIHHDGGRLVFMHPMLRTAVQRTATVEARRRAHDALAATSSGGERAWYLAADVTGTDERAATELSHAADEMRRRTGYADAARALHRAAELTADTGKRAGLLFAAAADAQRAGGLADAASWLGEARLLSTDPIVTADIALAQGRVLTRRGTPSIAQQVLVDAAEAVVTTDPGRAAALLCAATEPAMTEGRIRAAVSYAERAVELTDPERSTDAAHAQTILAQTLLFAGHVEESRALLATHRHHLDSLDPATQGEALAFLGLCWGWLEEYATATATLGRIIDTARRSGALSTLARALTFDAEVRRCTGEWLTGYVEAEEALGLARELREVSTVGFVLVILARFDSARGRRRLAHERLLEARRIAGPLGTPGLLLFEGSARGLLHLTAGDYDQAISCLEEVRAFAATAGLDNADFLPWASDLVEAYWRAGRSTEARDRLNELDVRSRASGLSGPQAAVARYRAVTTTDAGLAEVHFHAALTAHERRPQPFEAARTRLLMAEALRRNRRRGEARSLLRKALPVFERLDAEPYRLRAATELAAAGERLPARTDSPLTLLTPQELQVARAVADGMSNPEVAATLFISRKTVESHLSSVYRKFGLRSRTQLVRYLDDAQESADQSRGDGSGRRATTAGSA